MIRDLEAAADSDRGTLTSNRESNNVVDAIMKKVKKDIALDDSTSERNGTLVDVITFKVKSNFEDKYLEPTNETEKAFDEDAE